MNRLIPQEKQFFEDNGAPLVGGELYTLEPGRLAMLAAALANE